MHTKCASPSLGEHRKVSARLSCLHDAKRIFLLGNRKILSVVTCDLQENTAVGATLVGLPGRVQEPRSKSENGRDVLCVPHLVANLLESLFVFGVHRDVAQQSEIVSFACPAEMRSQDFCERLSLLESLRIVRIRVQLHAVAFEERLLTGQLPLRFVLARQFPGLDL